MKTQYSCLEESPYYLEVKNSHAFVKLNSIPFNKRALILDSFVAKKDLILFGLILSGVINFLCMVSGIVLSISSKTMTLPLIASLVGVSLLVISAFLAFFILDRLMLDDEINADRYINIKEQSFYHKQSRDYVQQQLDMNGKICYRDYLYLNVSNNRNLIHKLESIQIKADTLTLIKNELKSKKVD